MRRLFNACAIIGFGIFGYGWKLSDLFGVRILRSCNIARSSSVVIDTNDDALNFDPAPDSIAVKRGRKFAVFDMKVPLRRGQEVDIEVRYRSDKGELFVPKAFIPPPLVSVLCHLAGTGQAKGAVIYEILNASGHKIRVLFSHMIPWFLRISYHTMRLRCAKRTTKSDSILYYPARDRLSPHYLEMSFTIPAFSQCDLSIEFDKAMLRWTEYPPDAHHGFHVPAPMVTFLDADFANQSILLERSTALVTRSLVIPDEKVVFTTVYGEVLLVTLPTPDFSMPYNVICLVCTVVALAFGPIHNLTTKRFKAIEATKKIGPSSKLKSLICCCKQWLFRKALPASNSGRN